MLCSSLLSNILLWLHIQAANTGVHVGPWGGNGGVNPWTFIPDGRIWQINISAGSCVDSIQFTYIDYDGVKHSSDIYGGDGGSPHTITFADDENLMGVNGTVGKFKSFIVITSLSFQTNKKNFGPYGTKQGTSFSLPVSNGTFGGFSGKYGEYLDSFGVILHPSSFENTFRTNMAADDIQARPSGGKGGDNPCTFMPSGRSCQIRVNERHLVDSTKFTYVDHDHVKNHSETYGGDGGSPQTITFIDNENLIGINGTVGVFENFTVITSLSFQTNKKNHGSYHKGTSFSVTNGTFGGFIGNYEGYLHSFRDILHPSSIANTFTSNMAANGIHVGPWGGKGGVNPWTFMPSGRIFEIHIKSGLCVDSIRFTYIDHNHVKHHTKTYGGDGGSPQTITFADDENLIGINGTVGTFNSFTVITSLSFQTNKKNYGPYGTNQGSSFSLPVSNGTFSGFSGNYGVYLDSFGVILHPSYFENTFISNRATNGLQVGPWGGKGGAKPWTFMPSGRISQIRISVGLCVDSIRFTYIDHDHVKHHSETYGGDGGSPQMIKFADDENLIGISGTVGESDYITVITSLSFQTNKKNHGPYGTNQGTSFSLLVSNGTFSGFSGNYGKYLDSFGVILHPSSFENTFRSNVATNGVHVGPWGGKGGVNLWKFMPNGRICKIRIRAGHYVDSIRFAYIDHDHVNHHSETYGGDGGSAETIKFVDDENLTEISGTVGVFDWFTVITSLSFHTNKKKYGPYGTNQGTSFSLPISNGTFGGFTGNYGKYLDSFGVILHPSSFENTFRSKMVANSIHVGPWGGKDGVNPWKFMLNGRIFRIRIKAGLCVDSIMFSYIDSDLVQHHSEIYGGDGGSVQMILFADDEYLIGIDGTVGEFGRFTVITSLSFHTNKKNHGPYGTNPGTSFSLPVAKGRIGGFHGNYGDYLDSFGVILHPY